MAANLGSLVAVVKANTKPFEQGMNRTRGSMKKTKAATSGLSSRIGAMAGPVAIAAAAMAVLFRAVSRVKEQLLELDKLGKTADKLGMGAQQLEQLRYAAGRAGVEAGTLDMAMQRMVRRVSEAAMGTGEAVGALKELGVSAASLSTKSPDEQMRILADAMKKVKNPADRVRLAMKLFDSEGVALVNMLSDGSGALDEAATKFDELNGAMSRADIAKVEEANDAWKDVKVAMSGAWREFVISIAPVLTLVGQFITLMVKVAKVLFKFTAIGFLLSKLRSMKHHTDDIKDSRESLTPVLEGQLQKEKEIADAQQKQADDLKRQGDTIRREFMTPQEKFKDRMADLQRLVNAGAISWETYNRAVGGAVKDLKEANKQNKQLAKPKAVGAVMRGSGASFSAQQAARRDAEHQKRLQQQQLNEQTETNRILRSIDTKTEPTEVKAVNI